ncbi:hypothetical protein [Luteimonas aquatica]|uniref:hypothetical protein n=1 Tax=Luteimonas aquatica TaxID=450364 RepID=UPI001F57D878|nr:hypothetical protein [Luteimonas aquatica]
MKRLLLLLLIGGFAGIACAQAPAANDEGASETATAIGTQASDRASDRNCLKSTGSRIAAGANAKARKAGKPERACANAAGRSYTQDDLDRTGRTDVASALRQLDPSIR